MDWRQILRSLDCQALEAGLGLVAVRRHHRLETEERHGQNLWSQSLGAPWNQTGAKRDWGVGEMQARNMTWQ